MGIWKRKQNLKKMLAQYSAQDLERYKKYEEMPPHSFSSGYREKMENMGKQPVQRGKYTFAYRMAAACICAIVALLVVNQASAYIFGVTLWDKLMEPAPEKMVTTVYQEKESGRNTKRGGKERLHDIPTEIPEGYELVSEKSGEEGIFVKWQSGDNIQLSFASFEINQDVQIYDNGEWETVETVEVQGYQGQIYVQLERSYLLWDDEKYHNNIESINMSKEELLEIAESLYRN